MNEGQARLMAQFPALIDALTIGGATNDIHVGVVSSDLGTPGSMIPSCANSDSGDDGWLNPIRNGPALQTHQPWISAPAGFRPADCMSADEFPSFISFDSSTTDRAPFLHALSCSAGLYTQGCALEQQLESVWRALIWNGSPERTSTNLNAGFVRDDAILAIVMLTDEDDGSVRDCRYARGQPCTSGLRVYDASSNLWAGPEINLRFYLYQPGGEQDPTWNLGRYIDPLDASVGLLGLKPGHPERVIFAAITGIPLTVPTTGTGASEHVAWDRLLGTRNGLDPSAAPTNAFAARDTRTAIDEMSAEGPISMRQANQDPSCPGRVVPACRREGSTYDSAHPPCYTTQQYFAWPARRIVEIARRFDESTLCGGEACRNGIVSSICLNDFRPAVTAIAALITSRASGH